eukprot:Trichotokara_eunicae@DN11039_c0_g1_i1.p1
MKIKIVCILSSLVSSSGVGFGGGGKITLPDGTNIKFGGGADSWTDEPKNGEEENVQNFRKELLRILKFDSKNNEIIPVAPCQVLSYFDPKFPEFCLETCIAAELKEKNNFKFEKCPKKKKKKKKKKKSTLR